MYNCTSVQLKTLCSCIFIRLDSVRASSLARRTRQARPRSPSRRQPGLSAPHVMCALPLQFQCCSPYLDACQALAAMPSPDEAFARHVHSERLVHYMSCACARRATAKTPCPRNPRTFVLAHACMHCVALIRAGAESDIAR